MSAVSNVLVVGGGIGGLTAAVALRRQGVSVDVAEVSPDHSVYGVGIIQPNNTLRALDRLGLAEACIAEGGPFHAWRLHDGAGNFLTEVRYTSAAAAHLPPINGIARPKLQAVLLDAARTAGADIRLGVTYDTLRDDGAGVDVTFTDGSLARYDLVVASDGLMSRTREYVAPDAPKPAYSGVGVWRYNFVRPPEVREGEIHYGARTKVGLTPISPTTMYMFLVTHEPENLWFPRHELATRMREHLADYTGLIGELREQIVDPDGVVYRPAEHLMLAAPWHRGRVLVIGDAAHATTPHLAQGAAMAIEDAVLLGELLGRDTGLDDALGEFMARRYARAKYVVDSSTQLVNWEVEEWSGVHNPDARPAALMGEAMQTLMAAY